MKETTIKLLMDQFLAMPKEHIVATHIKKYIAKIQ